MGHQTPREDTQCQGQTNSPVSHHNVWDRAEVQPRCDTPVSVYDGGGQRVSETQPEVNSDAAKKYYVIHVDKLKLCTAAAQSQDSVATQPTTQ